MRVPGLIRTPAPLPASSYATPVAYFEDHYGPKRPYAPRDEWFSVINQAVDDTFGADHTVRMQSGSNIDYNGSGEALPPHGARRHGTGLAGDFSIRRPDGSIVPIDSPESLRFMQRASELGVTGIGAGTEYMGPTSYHMDLVTPDPARGEGHVWGSVARANAPSIVPLMTGQDSPSRIAGDAMDALGITMNANRPPQPAQPQGLLGFLGMQRQDQSAGGETAMPFYQRPTFQDFAGRAAQAFNTLRLRPDDQLGAVIKDRREGRQEEARASRTTDWLSQQPGSEAYVEAIRGGADPGAVLMEYQAARTEAASAAASAARGTIEQVDGSLVRVLPNGTVEELYAGGGDNSQTFDDVSKVRREFSGLSAVKSFEQQSAAYGRVVASAQDASAAGDLALIFNYMKVLDPGSTVREGEFATAQNSGGIDDRVRSIYNSVINGERLSIAQRNDFGDRATRLYDNAEKGFLNLYNQFSEIAVRQGMNVPDALIDFRYTGDRFTPADDIPPTPAGYTDADFRDLWNAMTSEQKTLYLQEAQN
tara:strand:- start:7155 stop:8759 length:1605 start_codon:yes stop_codon:yes gene_type:complete